MDIIANEIRSSVHFDITHKCNEKCIHCLVDKDNAEATEDDILNVLDQAARFGFTSFSFSGGEPTIHPDFFKILSAARDLGFYFTLFTNVINLSDNDINNIASLFPEKIRISLYSMVPEIHDHLTQIKGSHKKTMHGIRLFKNAGINLYINIPVTNQNYDGYRDVAEFCDNNGFGRNFDPIIQPTRDLRDKKLKLQLNYEQAKDVTGFQQNADVLLANVKDGDIVCNAGVDPSIDAKLNVYPCPGIRMPLGNLHQSTFKELMIGHPLITELQSLDLSKLDTCKQCEYLNGCYRCHGHGYQDGGSIYACSWYDKRQAKIRQELMIERGTLTAV
jgi:radical SAM protein with 4Fe4S-binding SPASM domain